ncbi:hypothetical protein OE810_06620 [Rhodobacteraceae bacterium XHP0102]|nr:hypothetical protein [Rhodobacteraceae bacterium XHP0102]
MASLLLVAGTICAGFGGMAALAAWSNRQKGGVSAGFLGAGLAMLIAVYTIGQVPLGWAPFAASFVEVLALILR